MSWNPSQYLQYEDARLRPALELLARVPVERPRVVVDLGCGAGNVAQWLGRRWTDARIVGVDGDSAMLRRARETTAGDERFHWVQADLARWRPDDAVDVIYSNAALHWLDDHATLFPTLATLTTPGGALAVQMPGNFGAPSHQALYALAHSEPWRQALAPLVRESPVHAVADYVDWLEPFVQRVDAWTTEYLQHLPARADGEHPVVAWMKGSALVPMLAALDSEGRDAFVAEYASRIDRAYPRRADGSVLFPFRRIFVVALRAG